MKDFHMKKRFWLVVLVGTVPYFCSSAASPDVLKKSEDVTLQQHREILGASILYIRVRNTVESSGKKWEKGEVKMISEIDFESRQLIITLPGGYPASNFRYTFKHLDNSQLNDLGGIIKSLAASFNDQERPTVWCELCKNAGVPGETPSIPQAIAFLATCGFPQTR